MKLICTILIFLSNTPVIAQKVKIIKRFDVQEAKQGIAVDDRYFYVINNSSISKHLKENGTMIAQWKDADDILHHLNSGIIIEGKLYCTNSNYPESPMASSIEVFDPDSMKHIGNHSFGIAYGSATWIDWYDDHWYVAFAHYTGRGSTESKNNSWSRIVKFDQDWRFIESWIFPKELIQHFGTRSNSGGVIINGTLLCTGHDEPEIYVLQFPKKGYTLEWVETYPVGSFGQGIAAEKKSEKIWIYGIVRDKNKVIVSEIKLTD